MCPIKFIVTLMIIVGWLLVFNAKIESNHTYLYEEYFIIFPEPNLYIWCRPRFASWTSFTSMKLVVLHYEWVILVNLKESRQIKDIWLKEWQRCEEGTTKENNSEIINYNIYFEYKNLNILIQSPSILVRMIFIMIFTVFTGIGGLV